MGDKNNVRGVWRVEGEWVVVVVIGRHVLEERDRMVSDVAIRVQQTYNILRYDSNISWFLL